ncbi:MAG: hypothetical protein CMP59_05410 [Flavobacteriales bacterium]|nr:hypothetical protein [Flavobacteriales bacterium]
MKKLLLLLSLISAFAISLYSQTDIYLNIDHKLGNADYSTSEIISNENDPYRFTRIEYYLSGFSVIHDSGQVTSIPSKFLLINAEIDSTFYLGNLNVNNIEGIQFFVGVDPNNNHLDPNSWPTNHPLAPKFPSMHWGWAAGYRFVAFEGQIGAGFNTLISIHGLGDSNYELQSHTVTPTDLNGGKVFNLTADYLQSLTNIPVDQNLNYHGEFSHGSTLISNFTRNVFSENTVGLEDQEKIKLNLNVWPNPSKGQLNVRFERFTTDLKIQVSDLSGKMVYSAPVTKQNELLEIQDAGIYLLSIYKAERLVATKKVIVQ